MATRVLPTAIHLDPRRVLALAREEAISFPAPLRRWLLLLGVLMLFGAYGAVRSLPAGAEVYGTTPAFEWSSLIAAYVFFVVTTSGLCLVSSLGHVFGIERFKPVSRRALVLAIIFLATGFGVIGLDLSYPERLAFGVALSPSPHSAMWWMGTLYSIYLVFLLIELFGVIRDDERISKLGATLALGTAVAAPSTLGGVFGVLVSRPYWHDGMVPVYMLITAVVSGAAVLGMVFYLVDRLRLEGAGQEASEVSLALGKVLALGLALVAFFTTWQLITGLYGKVPGASGAAKALLVGPLSPEFWIFRILIGLALPLALLLRSRVVTSGTVFAASCMAFVGIFADRAILVAAGQISPTTAASGIVSPTYASYSPSLTEISIIVGAVAFVAFAYTLAERYFPFREEHSRGHVAPLPAEEARS